MAVVVILGIVAGTAVVSMSSTTGNRSTVAARQLLRDMTFARQRAVATGSRTWVEFSTAADTWTVRAEDPNDPGRTKATILNDPATNAPFVQQLDTGQFVGVTLSTVDFDAEDWVGFDWLGRPLDKTGEATPLASDGTVTFSGGETITVNKDTGHITLAP